MVLLKITLSIAISILVISVLGYVFDWFPTTAKAITKEFTMPMCWEECDCLIEFSYPTELIHYHYQYDIFAKDGFPRCFLWSRINCEKECRYLPLT